MPLTPDEIKRGRELRNTYTESDARVGYQDWEDWMFRYCHVLLTLAENHAKEIETLQNENQCLKETLHSAGKLTSIESTRIEQLFLENKRLKEHHAKDVEEAYREGHVSAWWNVFNPAEDSKTWDTSQAKKKLEGG